MFEQISHIADDAPLIVSSTIALLCFRRSLPFYCIAVHSSPHILTRNIYIMVDNKSAFVTGCSEGGIGFAIVEKFQA